MTAFGFRPRTTAVIAAVLAAIGAVAVIAGYFSAREWIMVAGLVVGAAVKWRRAGKTPEEPVDPPKQ